MKKIEEMSNLELQQKIDLMQDVDSPEAKKLLDQFKTELDKREAEAKAKREAEEAKANAEAESEEKDLVNKQKSVLGKYYKKVFYDTNYLKPTVHYTVYYKVVGVYENKAAVAFVKKYEYSEIVSKAVTFVNLNDLFDKTEHYEEITRKEFNDIYEKSKLSFDNLTHVFEKLLQFPF